MTEPVPIFVYGSLKRGLSNVHWMEGATFLRESVTEPRYQMFDTGGFPGVVEAVDAGLGYPIEGEVWLAPQPVLERLDILEGVAEGLYRRGEFVLVGGEIVLGYFFVTLREGMAEVTSGCWAERSSKRA